MRKGARFGRWAGGVEGSLGEGRVRPTPRPMPRAMARTRNMVRMMSHVLLVRVEKQERELGGGDLMSFEGKRFEGWGGGAAYSEKDIMDWTCG